MLISQWDGLAPLSPRSLSSLKSPDLYQRMHFLTLIHKVPLSPAPLRNGFIQAKRKGLSLIPIPDTSHLSAIHTALQKAFPGNCVPKERKRQANKRPFDGFIRVQPTVLLYAKTGTGNTDVTSGSVPSVITGKDGDFVSHLARDAHGL